MRVAQYKHIYRYQANNMSIKFGTLVSSILLCTTASIIGYFLTKESVNDWYLYLNKPALNPPSWVFAPVWTILYLMMAIAWYNVRIITNNSGVKIANIFFIIQLFFNVLWSFAFFMLESPFLGLNVILFLLLFIIITTVLFFKQSKLAGWFMIPYFLWVSFASYLNFSIWLIN